MTGVRAQSSALDPLSVLVVHNKYQQAGGEDTVFELEAKLLESKGHPITRLIFDNATIPDRMSAVRSARLAFATVWSMQAAQQIREAVRTTKADIVHFHNTFPLISPAAYSVCKSEGAAVVQTLHNYRLMCPSALFFRDGHMCEDCLGHRTAWPSVVHACYRNSRSQTAVIAAMLATHRTVHTWQRHVDRYIALTEFSRQKFIEGSLPGDKIAVKPNFVNQDHGVGEHSGGYVLFAGRLAEEKGIRTLLQAWSRYQGSVNLKIVGDGPLSQEVREVAQQGVGVEWLGRQPREQVLALMKDAMVLLFPSLWYECFPMVIVEAYATGLPVIASNIGNMPSLIDHKRTGLLFESNDPADLRAKVEWAAQHRDVVSEMSIAARQEFETKYTAERNYQMMIDIYRQAQAVARGETVDTFQPHIIQQ